MNDYRIEAASKQEWAERALAAEAKLAIAVEALRCQYKLTCVGKIIEIDGVQYQLKEVKQ